jgi:hypothetical protein
MSLPATHAPDPNAGSDLVGTTIAERFRIDAIVGEGAMGTVFRARHLGLRKDVALKLLHRELTANAQMVARFDREAAAASRLDHPNCVRVMDFGRTEGGDSFLVMELLEGEELALRLPGPLPAFAVVDLVGQVLSALEHAHGHGLVHRDIKPENIFIIAGSVGEQVKILDFGIAKVQYGEGSTPLTQMGMVFGTPHYMSPEQALGKTVDARSDLYSLGVVMYEALTGRVPFPDDDAAIVLRGHIKEEPPPMPDSVPAPLRRFVGRMLAKAPGDRFPDAAAANDALRRAGVASDPPVRSGFTVAAERSPPKLPRPGALRSEAAATAEPRLPPPDAGPTDPAAPDTAASAEVVPDAVAPEVMVAAAAAAAGAVPAPPMKAGSPRPPRPMWHNVAVVVGGLAVAAGIFTLTRRDDPPADGTAAAAPVDPTVDPTPRTAEGDAILIDEAPAESGEAAAADGVAGSLASIDALIDAKQYASARIAIEPLLDVYPDAAALRWRMGRVLVKIGARGHGPEALSYYEAALKLDATLVDDSEFTEQLGPLLDDPKVRVAAAELAMTHLGEAAHDRLIAWVNVQRGVLPIATRRAVIEHLREGGKGDAINTPLQTALDLWQAKQADEPCEVFAAALATARDDPDSFVWGTLAQVEVPKVGPEPDAEVCPDLAALQAEIAESYAQRYAGLTPTVPAAFAKRRPAPANNTNNRRRNGRRRR